MIDIYLTLGDEEERRFQQKLNLGQLHQLMERALKVDTLDEIDAGP